LEEISEAVFPEKSQEEDCVDVEVFSDFVVSKDDELLVLQATDVMRRKPKVGTHLKNMIYHPDL